MRPIVKYANERSHFEEHPAKIVARGASVTPWTITTKKGTSRTRYIVDIPVRKPNYMERLVLATIRRINSQDWTDLANALDDFFQLLPSRERHILENAINYYAV